MRKELPYDDPEIVKLTPTERAGLAGHWHKRAYSERSVGLWFSELAARLALQSASSIVLDLLHESAAQEQEHSNVCLRLAEAYGGLGLQPLTPAGTTGTTHLPDLGLSDLPLETLLLVAGTCCINETIAVTWLEECLRGARTPLAIAANKMHLADEISHARLGWAHLGSSQVTPAMKRALGRYLPKLLEANLPGWEQPDAYLPFEGIPSHGQPSTIDARRVIHETVSGVILPGFAHLGVDVGPATAYWQMRLAGC